MTSLQANPLPGRHPKPVRLRTARRLAAPLVLSALALAVTGCAATGDAAQRPESTADPLERVNRGVFGFNRAADKVLLRPVARGYRAITPRLVRKGVNNLFDTLSIPRTLVSNLLQGKGKAAVEDVARLLVNVTVGLGGLIDVASRQGIPKNDEDFGQTLAVWGVQSGPYLMVPILGAYTLRDGFGELGDWPLRPVPYIDDSDTRVALEGLYLVHRRTQLLATDSLVDGALDPYVFVREAYLQRRQFLIHDGNPPDADEGGYEDFDADYSEEDFLGGE